MELVNCVTHANAAAKADTTVGAWHADETRAEFGAGCRARGALWLGDLLRRRRFGLVP